jgi:tetratricopeptide (TPR) repeat protein
MFPPQTLLCITLLTLLAAETATSQSASKSGPDASAIARKAVTLADSGRCGEALPALKKSVGQLKDRDLKLKIALDGVRCAMSLHQSDSALEFLRVLTRDFPNDPDSLYVAIHAYSDLSTQASQQLARSAPSSYQAHELLAESFETQGKWDDAEKEYRAILKQDQNLPGIHFRLGRAMLSTPNPAPELAEQAKREFEQELQIDPTNAGAEYVKHFSRASRLDPQFGEAFFGLGASLVSEKQFADAIAPLETAVKLEPRNPDAHYSLAMAYTRAGRKQDGEREFAIHKQIIGAGGDAPQAPAAEESK